MTRVKMTYKSNKGYYKNLEKALIEDVEDEIERTTTDIETDAIVNAPVDLGILRSSINKEVKGLDGRVFTNVKYAPFMEFGTGGFVDVPEGLQDYAIQYKGQGIRQVNIPPKPFLFPAWRKHGQLMLERLQKKINGTK